MKLISLKENHLFQKTYSGGKRAFGRFTAVYVLGDLRASKLKKANPQKVKINRVGITVTKKSGGAVQRNRVRRIIREAYRQLDLEYGLRRGNLVVISAREAAGKAKTPEVKQDMKKMLCKLGMITDAAKQNPDEKNENADKLKDENINSERIMKNGIEAEKWLEGAADAGDKRL